MNWRFWKKGRVAVASKRDQLPRLLRAGIDKMVAEAILGAQDEIIEKQVNEYRELLRARVKEKVEISVVSTLGHVMNMKDEQFNIVVNLKYSEPPEVSNQESK